MPNACLGSWVKDITSALGEVANGFNEFDEE
jgi:hypothetical protein